MILRAHGLSVAVPRGWDARIFRRTESIVTSPATGEWGAPIPQSGVTAPVVHVANFALPEGRGDYGSGAVDRMGASHAFVALVEFGPESVGSALFSTKGVPKLRSGEFSGTTMQRPFPQMGGAQRFFVASGRAFCCYAVVGSLMRRTSLVAAINGALAGVTVDPVG